MNLADHIAAHEPEVDDWYLPCCACGWADDDPVEDEDQTFAAHAAHVAAAWAEHRTITTLAGLVGLPSGSVIRADGLTLDLGADPDVPDAWAIPGPGRMVLDHKRVPLPATVLYNPEEDQ